MKYIILILLTAACMPERGPQGYIGPSGPIGIPGDEGPPGRDTVPIRVIQLCPGVTTYPTVFVEVALCINQELWGVYSANGGFLTLLPPGNYSSNAIGSACNLTIKPNCEVL